MRNLLTEPRRKWHGDVKGFAPEGDKANQAQGQERLVTDTARDLAGRIEQLEVRERIEALKASYWRAIDQGDAEAVAACLTTDAKIDFEGLPPFDSAEDFLVTVRASAAAGGAHHLHHGRNPIITVESQDAATGRWDIQYRGLFHEPQMIVRMSGVYDDHYRRENGAWKIAAMRMRQTSFLSELIDQEARSVVNLPCGGPLDFTQSSPEAQ